MGVSHPMHRPVAALKPAKPTKPEVMHANLLLFKLLGIAWPYGVIVLVLVFDFHDDPLMMHPGVDPNFRTDEVTQMRSNEIVSFDRMRVLRLCWFVWESIERSRLRGISGCKPPADPASDSGQIRAVIQQARAARTAQDSHRRRQLGKDRCPCDPGEKCPMLRVFQHILTFEFQILYLLSDNAI